MTVRIARLSLALCIAAPLVATPLRAQGVEYAAGTTRYHLTTTTKGSQTSPMGNADFEVGVEQKITVNVMRHAKDTVMATITLDTIALKSSGPSPDLSKLQGAKFVSLISPTGKFYSTINPAGIDPMLAQLTESISRILPSFRTNLAAGYAWSDTTADKVTQQGLDLDRNTVTAYKVAGDTMIAGERAFRIDRTTSVKAAGSGTMQGTPISMESVSSSSGAFFMTPKGVFLGGNNADDVDVKITILAQNVEVNIKQKGQTRIEAIK